MLPKTSKEVSDTTPGSNAVFEFGPYLLDTKERQLLRDGERVRVPPKALELLIFLVERKNRVASKEEILDSVWNGSFIEEANIAVHVSNLRKVFAEDEEPVVNIETVPKVGYRLIVEDDVRIESANGVAQPLIGIRAKRRRWMVYSGFALALLIGLTGIILLWPRGQSDPNSWRIYRCPDGSTPLDADGGSCDDPAAQFTILANPNGNWSYGYSPFNNISVFKPFQFTDRNSYFEAVPGMPMNIWRNSEAWQPSIMINTSDKVIVPQAAFTLPPGMLNLHPGPDGQRSVLRWIAPRAGIFKFEGAFWSIDVHETSSDFSIVQNGKVVITSKNISGYGIETPFVITPQVVAGDTIDFSVGYGASTYESDSTGLTLFVTEVSPAR
jgi:DNA-binding winged helix-turn-helix (wHTH) protein